MKKTLTILLLVLAITTSLIAGTMAYYTVTLDNLVQGSVTAKDFLMLVKDDSEGPITEQLMLADLLIAPGETVEWDFTVQNYGDQRITETDLYYRLTFSAVKPNDKELIVPLEVTVLKGENSEGTFNTNESQIVDGAFPFTDENDNKQEQTFTVKVYWPHTTNDSAYIGHGYGATIKVDAIAQQAPFDPIEQPVDPETPGEPEPVDPDDDDEQGNDTEEKLIEVVYKIVTKPNPGWADKFEYEITIKNLTDSNISNWKLSFKLASDQFQTNAFWNAKISFDGDKYHITAPSQHNQEIKTKNTVSFGGHGNTTGSESAEDLMNLTLSGTIMENGTTKTVVYRTDQIKYTKTP